MARAPTFCLLLSACAPPAPMRALAPVTAIVDAAGWIAGYEIQTFGVRFVRR